MTFVSSAHFVWDFRTLLHWMLISIDVVAVYLVDLCINMGSLVTSFWT